MEYQTLIHGKKDKKKKKKIIIIFLSCADFVKNNKGWLSGEINVNLNLVTYK